MTQTSGTQSSASAIQPSRDWSTSHLWFLAREWAHSAPGLPAIARGQNLLRWLDMKLSGVRNDALEEAAVRLEQKAQQWQREAERHLPHHNSTCAERDIARRDTCNQHAEYVRELKTDAYFGPAAPAQDAASLPDTAPAGSSIALNTDGAQTAELVERLARAMAKKSMWDGWDTATSCNHTPNGTEPEEERDYWREMAQVALSELAASAGQ